MAKAGWYNDDLDPTLARWFDGEGWTEHVTEKAYWESVGQEPPPPYELEAAVAPAEGSRRRAWIAVGSAAVVGALAITGVALAQGGGGGGPDSSNPARRSDATTRTTDTVVTTDDLGVATSLDPLFGADVEDGGGSVAVGGRSTQTTAKGGSKSTKTTTKGGVTHTETRSESHTSPNITSSPPSGDKTSVGHSTNTSISTNTTIKTTTTASTTPSDDGGSDTTVTPPADGTDGGGTGP